MNIKDPKESKERMIHVRLPEAMHRKVRIRAAETDKTIQDWVFEAIKRELERQETKEHEKGV
jgi:predicted HicB family RNase H-like nuclease